jgi:hypothetical protein
LVAITPAIAILREERKPERIVPAIARGFYLIRQPLAAITPVQVRVRGPESFVWPDGPTIRKIAARLGPGLTKRLALLVDD